MRKIHLFIITIVCILTALLIYTPHLTNQFPLHVDEWHHIAQSVRLESGEYRDTLSSLEKGFHIFLSILSKFINLISNYKYLAPIWAVFASLSLFLLAYKKTSNFNIAILAMIFFASIKSNVNILGLWFFVPLTFTLPLIFLYIFLYTEGLEKKNRKYIIASMAIMIPLIYIHAIAVLFALPFLIIYSLFHIKFIKKERKLFLSFLALPILGVIFFLSSTKFPTSKIIELLQFKAGWSILELNNSPLELYSPIGYALAFLGAFFIIKHYLTNKRDPKLLAYLIWPITLLIMIAIFKLTGISPLSPYQRNLYYFIMILPLLSAIGLYNSITLFYKKAKLTSPKTKKIITIIIIIVILILTFKSYFSIPEQIRLYHTIDKDDYLALQFLSNQEKGNVITTPTIGSAVYATTGHAPTASLYFEGLIRRRKKIEDFFSSYNCDFKNKIIDEFSADYVLTKSKMDCQWPLIYGENGVYVYKVS